MSKCLWDNALFIDANDKLCGIRDGLVSGEYPIVVIKNALDLNLRTELLTEVKNKYDLLKQSHYVNGTLTTLGSFIARHLDNPMEYFLSNVLHQEHVPSLAHEVKKYVYSIVSEILQLDSLKVAQEPIYGDYAPFIIRVHSNGVSNPLHNDHIARDAKNVNLLLKDIETQFSCIICLQECDNGGELVMYRKKWSIHDEVFKITNGLGYESELIEGVESFAYKPSAGDIYIINPTYFHEINQVIGQDRVTMGFFFGLLKDEYSNAIAWS